MAPSASFCERKWYQAMKRKTIPKKRWLAGFLAVLLLLPFAVSAGPETTEEPEKPAVQTAAPADGYVLYAEQSGWSLYVHEKDAVFAVRDAEGRCWYSTPPSYEEDETAKGDAKKLLGSLIQINYADGLGNINVLSSRKESVEKGTASVRRIDGGARMDFLFERQGITVPVEILLREDGVEISVVTAEITETADNYRLLSVEVAPYFSAAGAAEDGYILVPDGSGALIDWKDNGGYAEDYSQYVYGRDESITQLEAGAVTETVRLPVFGMKHGDTGFTGILTAGASRAVLNASVQGKRCAYSNVFAEFLYRDTDMVLVEKKNQTVRIVETSHTADKRQTVRYVLTTGEDASYVGMASIYRDYLLNEEGLTSRAKAGNAPLVVELFGGVMSQQYVFGFPVKRVAPLTTFEDAQTILNALKEAGVDQVLLNYTYWNKDATGAAIQTALKPEGRLGGGSGLKALAALCGGQDTPLYLNVNTNRMVKSAWGYNKKNDAASSVQRNPAMQYEYDLSTGKALVSSPSFLLKPTKLLALTQRLAESAEKYEITGLSTSFLSDVLYSDFGRGAVTRDQSEAIWKEALAALAAGKGSLLVAGGNAYALSKADFVTDAPTGSSQFLIETEEVPFYQIVLHGIVPLSTTSLNEMGSARQGLLKAVETGSSLKYRWIARNETELEETAYNDVISARYMDWLDTAVAQYEEAETLLKTVANQTIVRHEKLENGVSRTTWSDGTVVLVNFSKEAVSADGAELAAESFRVTKGGTV